MNLCSRIRPALRRGVAFGLGAGLGLSLLGAPAGADEQQDLIAEMERISRDANARNEEVKALEGEVARTQAELDRLRAEAAAARAGAEAALGAQREHRGEVDRISGALYRGVNLDPITNAIGGDDPQEAVDRAAYISALSHRTRMAVTALDRSTRLASTRMQEASLKSSRAELERITLGERLDRLRGERDDLNRRQAEVQERIDALDAAARRAWEERNNPLAPDPGAVVDAFSGAVAAAMSKLGAPYEWGAAGPDSFDCSGLVYWAHQQVGKSIPRTSQAQIAGGTPVSRGELQPGDVVGFYPGVTHVGLYIGDGRIVHASDYGIPVQVVPVDSMPFAGAARY